MTADQEFRDISKSLIEFFAKKRKQKFFGEITFKLQEGEITNVAVKESFNRTGFMVVSIAS